MEPGQTLQINQYILTAMIIMLIIISVSGFALPPFWRATEFNCSMEDGIVTDKGSIEHCAGKLCYNEYWIEVENNNTIWVSPASHIIYENGTRYLHPVC